jgi:small-conductance mechanosensitive channel
MVQIFKKSLLPALFLFLVSSFSNPGIVSQTIFHADSTKSISGFPVILQGDTLLFVYSNLGTFSSNERAKEISRTLELLSKESDSEIDSINSFWDEGLIIVSLHDRAIMSITKNDALSLGRTQEEAAVLYINLLKEKLKIVQEEYSDKSILKNSIITVLLILLLVLIIWASVKIFPKLYDFIKSRKDILLKSIKVKERILFSSSSITSLLILIARGVRLIIALLALYIILNEVFLLWPYTRKWDLQPIIKALIQLVFFSIVFTAVIKGIKLLNRLIKIKMSAWKEKEKKPIGIKSVEIIPAERIYGILTIANKFLFVALIVFALYIYITLVFSLFTFSQDWSAILIDYVMTPFLAAINSLIEFLPNLVTIIVITILFYYLIKLVKLVFTAIDSGALSFSGFYKEWAVPTYKIVRFMIIVLAAIIIFPYLPGSNSPFFQGISVFLGILFSLGSSSAISNMVAGVVLTYMRPFKIGDRVKIADTMGDVIEKTLLVTRVRTTKNVDITVPNSMVLGSHIINFSSSALDKGLILHTTVTIGYDVPWKEVHELLISAAYESEYIMKDPKPFVLQTSLDDHYVSYELNAFTDQPNRMAMVYSELHSKIQDKFNEAGVEIMSPQYSAVRDGNQTTIPEKYLPKEYNPPSFRLFGVDFFGKDKKK